MEGMISEVIAKAVKDFNKYRYPEAKAKLISLSKKSLKIEFTGPFCTTCGFYDYFDDFRLILEEKGLKTKTGEKEGMDQGAVVEFNISG
jgi:hypothetical protein